MIFAICCHGTSFFGQVEVFSNVDEKKIFLLFSPFLDYHLATC